MILRPNGAQEAAQSSPPHRDGQGLVLGPVILVLPLICSAAHSSPHWPVSGLLIHDQVAFMARGLSEHKLCPCRCLHGTRQVVSDLAGLALGVPGSAPIPGPGGCCCASGPALRRCSFLPNLSGCFPAPLVSWGTKSF